MGHDGAEAVVESGLCEALSAASAVGCEVWAEPVAGEPVVAAVAADGEARRGGVGSAAQPRAGAVCRAGTGVAGAEGADYRRHGPSPPAPERHGETDLAFQWQA